MLKSAARSNLERYGTTKHIFCFGMSTSEMERLLTFGRNSKQKSCKEKIIKKRNRLKSFVLYIKIPLS